ncbi:MAG: hypothetical protein ACREBU_19150, partial [Nitrososphaera sp.]
MARVKMVLKNGKEKVTIERTKALGKATTHFSIQTEGREYEDEKAENKFFFIFGITLDDFIRSVYLHQEAIRGLLTDDPLARNDALDRLFGLERLRNITSGIPLKEVAQTIEKLNEKKEKTSGKLSGGIQVCQQQLVKLEEKGGDNGMKQDEINIGQARKAASAIKKEINSICDDYSLEKQEINVPAELDNFSVFESRVKKSLKQIERQSIDDGKMTAIKYEKRTLEELMHSITKQEEPIAKLQKQVGEIVASEGDHQTITSKIATINKKIEDENKHRDGLDIDSKLIGDAIASLKLLTKPLCPVCNQKIDVHDVLHDLEKRAKRAAAEQILVINSNVSRLATEKSRLEEISEKVTRLTEAIEQEQTLQYEAIDQLARDLEVSIEKKAVMTAAKEKLSEFAFETGRLERADSERTERIQGVREEIDKIK